METEGPKTQEFMVSLRQAQEICERLSLPSVETITRVSGGTVNPIFSLDDRFILKVNTLHPEIPKLQTEVFAMKLLRERTSIPVPEVVGLDTSKTLLPYDCLLLEHKGRSLYHMWDTLTPEKQRKLAKLLGRYLGEMSKITFQEFGGFQGNTFWGIPAYKDFFEKRLQEGVLLNKKALALSAQEIAEVETVLRASSIATADVTPAFVHGDYTLRNILINAAGGMSVIDFEWTHAGFSEEDIAKLVLRTRNSGHRELAEQFLAGYQELHDLDDGFFQRAKEHLLFYYFRVLPHLWSEQRNNKPLIDEYFLGVRQLKKEAGRF